jgi:abortive infection bacteriophage resistance protein
MKQPLTEKKWLNYHDQLSLLESRGMLIGDFQKTLDYLKRVGYYRLSAYWYPFRNFELVQASDPKMHYQKLDSFQDNTHFLDAVELYLFDKKLKLLLVDALERIEVSLRVEISHLLGRKDQYAHLKPTILHPSFVNKKNAYQRWLSKYEKHLSDSKEDFVKHHQQHYQSKLPVWVACEIWDFGSLSKLLSMMKVQDQQAIAVTYGFPEDAWQLFQSWVHTLNYVRNVCAHHSRLWNRNLDVQPKMVKGLFDWSDVFANKSDLTSRSFVVLAITRYLVRQICPNTEWHERISDHLKRFPTMQSSRAVGLADMGCPEGWQDWWDQ